MSKKTSKETLKIIYDIIKQIYMLETKMSEGKKQNFQKAYLSRVDDYKRYKTYIHYNDLKKYAYSNYEPKKIMEGIRKIFPNQETLKVVSLSNFKNSEDLKGKLTTNKSSFFILDNDLIEIIFQRVKNKDEQLKGKEISYKIDNGKLIIKFDENDMLYFKINNGIIGISTIIEQKINQQENLTKKTENILYNLKGNNKGKNILNDEILKGQVKEFIQSNILKDKYKHHLEILIRLYLSCEEINGKENISFIDLNEQKSEQFFLINNEWVEKLKSLFQYEELKSYLINLNKDINSNSDEDKFESFFSILPPKFFNKTMQESIDEIEKNIPDVSPNTLEVNINNKQTNYFTNFQMINPKTYGLIINLNYKLAPIIIDLYYIGNNRLLLKFQNHQYCDEIGFINEQNIFIPEYILNYISNFGISFLNSFFKNGLFKEKSKKLEQIFDDNNSIVGYCYSLKEEKIENEEKKKQNDENQNVINNEDNQDEDSLEEKNNNNNEIINNDNDLDDDNECNIEQEEDSKSDKEIYDKENINQSIKDKALYTKTVINKNSYLKLKKTRIQKQNNKAISGSKKNKKRNPESFQVFPIHSFEVGKGKRKFNENLLQKYSLGKNTRNLEDDNPLKKHLEEKQLKEDIKTLIELFEEIIKHRNNLKNKLIQDINESNEDEYYLMDKNRIKYIMDFFEFKTFLFSLENENLSSKKDIISMIKKNSVIKKKIKEKDKIDFNVDNLKKETKKIENENIEYYTNFEIINETIKKLLEKFIQIQITKKAQCLMGNKNILIHFNDAIDNNIILLGKFDVDMSFITNVLIKFNDNQYKYPYINKLKAQNFGMVKKIFFELNQQDYINLERNEGIAYKIDFDEDIEKIIKKFEKESLKNQSQTNNTENQSIEDEEFNIIQDMNKNSIEKNDNKQNEQFDEIEDNGEYFEEINDFDHTFEKRQIKALISYYFFYHNLKKNLEETNRNNKKFIKDDCYLINYTWMQNYKKFYLYEQLVDIIETMKEKINFDNVNVEQIIYENLEEIFMKKIYDKENDYYQNDFENNKYIQFSFKKLEGSTTYPINFQLINLEVFNQIKQRKSINLDLIQKSYIINSNKIIIQYKRKSFLQIIIGKIDFTNYKFIPEKILNYNSEIDFLLHYKFLSNYDIEYFIKKKIYKNQIIEKSSFVGKIYEIGTNPEKETKKENNGIITQKKINDYENQVNQNQNKNIIQLLFNLHYFSHMLKFEIINNSQNHDLKKCYLIKKELIEEYNKIYNFNSIIKKYTDTILEMFSSNEEELKDFYKSLIKKYQAKFINNDLREMNYNITSKQYLFDISPTIYEYFPCFEDYILSNEPFEQTQSIYDFYYIIIEKKILLIFNFNINIGILDEKSNAFIPEVIIKFEKKENLSEIFNLIRNNGIKVFIANFKILFQNSNCDILILGSNDEIENKKIKFNNFFNEDISQKQFEKEKNKNPPKINIKGFIQMNKEKKIKKANPLKNVLSVILDAEIIKKKSSKSLTQSKEEYYYLLNFKWFQKYIKMNKLNEIFDYLINNNILESYINDEFGENISINNINISEIIAYLGTNDQKSNNLITNNYLSIISDHKTDFSFIKITKNEYLTYYKEFFLISFETKALFEKELSPYPFKIEGFPVYIGSGKMFIIIQSSSKNTIEIGDLNQENMFTPKMFFDHKSNTQLNMNINLLITEGFTQYQKYFLMFNDDYLSPIFDKNNNRIGQAYRYDESIKEYTNYIYTEFYLKFMVKLYLSNYYLRTKFNKDINQNTFYIINENYLKKLENYSLIKDELNNIGIHNDLYEIINGSCREGDLDRLIEGKKVAITIKKLLSKKIHNLNEINYNESEIPNLVPFSCNNNEIFYFDNFRLLDISINEQLGENIFKLFKNFNNNIVKCRIIETYILIDVSNNNNNEIYNSITEICILNDDNLLKPVYLLAYYNPIYFSKHLNHVFNSLQLSFKNFLESLSFSQGNSVGLEIDEGDEVGYIFKINNQLTSSTPPYIPSPTPPPVPPQLPHLSKKKI